MNGVWNFITSNWKTSSLGIGALLVGVGHWITTGSPSVVDVMAVLTGFGLIHAKDA